MQLGFTMVKFLMWSFLHSGALERDPFRTAVIPIVVDHPSRNSIWTRNLLLIAINLLATWYSWIQLITSSDNRGKIVVVEQLWNEWSRVCHLFITNNTFPSLFDWFPSWDTLHIWLFCTSKLGYNLNYLHSPEIGIVPRFEVLLYNLFFQIAWLIPSFT